MIFRATIFLNSWDSKENSECILFICKVGLRYQWLLRRKREEIGTCTYRPPASSALENWQNQAWPSPADCVILWTLNAVTTSTAYTVGSFLLWRTNVKFQTAFLPTILRDKFFLWHTYTASCLELLAHQPPKVECMFLDHSSIKEYLSCGKPYCRAIPRLRNTRKASLEKRDKTG